MNINISKQRQCVSSCDGHERLVIQCVKCSESSLYSARFAHKRLVHRKKNNNIHVLQYDVVVT